MPAVSIPVTNDDVTSLVTVTNQLFATATPVSSLAVYTSPIFANDSIYLLRGRIISDKAGTLDFQVSDDGVTWDSVYGTPVTIGAATIAVVNDVPSGGVMRYVYTDTSDASSTYFRFSVYAVKVTLN